MTTTSGSKAGGEVGDPLAEPGADIGKQFH
jgi:hypothetical protein